MAASNVLVKLALAAGVALASIAVLAAGAYYFGETSNISPQADRALPPRQASPIPKPVPFSAGHNVSHPIGSVDERALAVVAVGSTHDTPSPPSLVRAQEGPEFTPTPVPSPTLVPSLSKDAPNTMADEAAVAPVAAPTPPEPETMRDAPTVVVGQVVMRRGGKMRAPDPTLQTAGSGPDDQIQFTAEKEALKYPRLGSHLNRLVASVESGQATAEQAAESAAIYSDGSIAVTIHLSGKAEAVARFLEDKGGDLRNVGEDYIEAYVPVTLLGPLSQHVGVLRVREIIPPQPAGPSQPAGRSPP